MSAFLIGGGQILEIHGERGATPACQNAKYKPGDIVKIKARKDLAHFPRKAVIAVAIPPGFSPDHALADLLGEPRPLLAVVGARVVTYILVNDGDPKPYLIKESDLRDSGEPPIAIGTFSRGVF